ncbi:MAG: hypothetical protein ACI9XO_001452 [Paraglaciecola sp.]|jgi:hypothetical protein
MKRILLLTTLLFCCILSSFGQEESINKNKFRQLYQELPTPNVYRNAAGAPGHQYWQQKADYKINIELDDSNQRVYGEETITYINNSPDALEYLWVQLDQNMRAKDSDTYKIRQTKIKERMTLKELKTLVPEFDGGFKLDFIKDMDGNDLNVALVKTMLRIDLQEPLKAGEQYKFQIKWWYNINDRTKIGGRSGYEYFEDEDNYLYTIAQFFPRMAVYTDNEGWQNKQFLGRGEFTLTFGDYEVDITVPADHVVAATGMIQNEEEVLSKEQQKRWENAQKSFDKPVFVITESEARKAEKSKASGKKTWKYKAKNVRDFAFSSSRKFIWDAMAVKQADGTVAIAASLYPKEGNPLWELYSTKAVAHTLKWYSHYTIPYPYPIAWSIHTDKIGMEYPMICFNGGRPEPDGTYTKRTKYGLIGVIIHEVGHNYFPMIINSDERQWTWMDEGLNTFVQYLAQEQWERDYPQRRGPASLITNYMKGDKTKIAPIMTNSESIFQFGNNAYGKPATALNILRETILGRELFDYAFKRYCERWEFKHPSPADFFRTMEDASGVDLDWFWRGWFYGTDHVDIAINNVKWIQLDSKNPEVESIAKKKERDIQPTRIGETRNQEFIAQTQDEIDKDLRDFYTDYDPLDFNVLDKEEYQEYYNNLSSDEKSLLNSGRNFYELTFENIGGLVMPLIIEFEFLNGDKEVERIPAEIWRMNDTQVTKVFVFDQEVKQIMLDPFLETADVETGNNYYPPRQQMNRFELYKRNNRKRENPMQLDEKAKKKGENNK